MDIHIRILRPDDPAIIEDAFREQGWRKPAELYERYLAEQENGLRVTLVAEADGEFAGYGNVIWQPDYAPFREQGIPEISDLNVLIRFRKQGIASRLMERAEQQIAERSSSAGIGGGAVRRLRASPDHVRQTRLRTGRSGSVRGRTSASIRRYAYGGRRPGAVSD